MLVIKLTDTLYFTWLTQSLATDKLEDAARFATRDKAECVEYDYCLDAYYPKERIIEL